MEYKNKDFSVKRDVRLMDAIVTIVVLLFGCGFGALVSFMVFVLGVKYPILYLVGFFILLFPLVYILISVTRDILLSLGGYTETDYGKHSIFKK